MGSLKKLFVMMIVLAFFAIMPNNTQAAYRFSLTGAVDFQAEPWTATNFSGFVVVSLGEESDSQVDVTLMVTGQIAPWLNWTTPSVFIIDPGEQLFVYYDINFPAMAPHEYTGQITAIGTPLPDPLTGEVTVHGNIAVAIGISVTIYSGIYLKDLYADGVGAMSTVVNYENQTFNGTVEYNLTQSTNWIETQTVNVTDLQHNDSYVSAVVWNNSLSLGVRYTVTFRLRDINGTLIDELSLEFRLPTPADFIDVWHEPHIVYEDYDADIFATVLDPQNGLTECTCHYIIDGGAEQTGPMDFNPLTDTYRLLIDNTSYHTGSIVEYWATSFNNVTGTPYEGESVHKTFRIYSSTAPDLAIDATSFQFIPIDPQNQTMYDANSTNIYVTVRNIGRGDATDVVVQLIDEHNDTVAFTNLRTIVSIASLSINTATFSWNYPTAGTHNLRFVVDPDNNINETNENNNYYSVEVEIIETPEPPITEEENPWGILPFILIPLIVLIVLLLFLLLGKRGRINVRITEVKEYTHTKDGTARWRYTCTYAEGYLIGITESTLMRAMINDTISVKPKGIYEKEDGTLGWQEAKVKEVMPGAHPDSEVHIRQYLKKEKR